MREYVKSGYISPFWDVVVRGAYLERNTERIRGNICVGSEMVVIGIEVPMYTFWADGDIIGVLETDDIVTVTIAYEEKTLRFGELKKLLENRIRRCS